MAISPLKERLQNELKEAMRARNRVVVETIRFINAALKQREVDERIELTDADVLALLDKLVKQRRDSIAQFQQGGRADLVAKEQAQLDIVLSFMPQALTSTELESLIRSALVEVGAKSMADMGKVMACLKPQIQGRADLSVVSTKIKALLT